MPKSPKRRIRKPKPTKTKKRNHLRSAVVAGVKADQSVNHTKRVVQNRKIPKVWNMANGRVPERLLIAQELSDYNLAQAPAAATDRLALNLNSLHVPDPATARQPELYDVLSTIYKLYKVHRVDIKLNIRNTTSVPIIVGLLANDASLASNLTLDQIRTRANTSIILNAANTPGDRATLSMKVNLRRFVGQRFMDAGYGAGTGASPSEIVYCHICTASTDTATNITYRIGYDIMYYSTYSATDITRNLD